MYGLVNIHCRKKHRGCVFRWSGGGCVFRGRPEEKVAKIGLYGLAGATTWRRGPRMATLPPGCSTIENQRTTTNTLLPKDCLIHPCHNAPSLSRRLSNVAMSVVLRVREPLARVVQNWSKRRLLEPAQCLPVAAV